MGKSDIEEEKDVSALVTGSEPIEQASNENDIIDQSLSNHYFKNILMKRLSCGNESINTAVNKT